MRVLSAAEFLAEGTPSDSSHALRIAKTVSRILADVRAEGDEAVARYTWRHDRVRVDDARVSSRAVRRAWHGLPAGLQTAFREAQRNLEAVQGALRPPARGDRITPRPGVTVRRTWQPLDSVACYAPGGRAAYPSTVLMMAAPARAARVPRLVLLTPPQRGGLPSPSVLAAAHLAGIDEVYAVGGAQAIAAVAFGTETIPRAAKVVGPGNAYVAEAKRQAFGHIGIDTIAGPTELAIVTDGTVDPELVATDLAAQAEHDPDSRTLVVVPRARAAGPLLEALDRVTRHDPRASIIRRALRRAGRIIVATSMSKAVDVLNAYAPEHVELLVRRPDKYAARIRNAGTMFLGPETCAPLGDYVTGANHVLPTGGSARWASGLNPYDFVRQVLTQRVTRAALRRIGPAAVALARAEGLGQHAAAVQRRLP